MNFDWHPWWEALSETQRKALSNFDTWACSNIVLNWQTFSLLRAKVCCSGSRLQERTQCPSSSFLVDFLRKMSRTYYDPAFHFKDVKASQQPQGHIHACKSDDNVVNRPLCPVHKTQHSLAKFRAFLAKSWEDKKTFLKEKKLCSKCLTTDHSARNCKANVRCEQCGRKHHTAMHHAPAPYQGHQPWPACLPPTAWWRG